MTSAADVLDTQHETPSIRASREGTDQSARATGRPRQALVASSPLMIIHLRGWYRIWETLESGKEIE